MADDVADEVPEREMYWDPVNVKMRARKGRRRRRKGPNSLEEENLNKAFYAIKQSERRMNGELAQIACREMTVYLVQLKQVCDRFSFDAIENVTVEDVEMLREELRDVTGMYGQDGGDEFDLGDLT